MSVAMERASVSSASSADFTSEKALEQPQQTVQTPIPCNTSPIPSSFNNGAEQPDCLQTDLNSNLSDILNVSKNDDIKNESSSMIGDDAGSLLERELEVQQKAFKRFTSSLNDLGFRTTFPVSVFPPFLAAFQQNPLALHNQFGVANSNPRSSGVSPGLDDDDENEAALGSTEPEDLTINFRKEKKDSVCATGSTGDDNADSDASGQQNWSYEEQFKQLYELSDDVKRKEWLDDWLSFMHRIGKPVTRIPIMAKQVLDLYELYRLVVQHGGLVEIINKKLWREITKGLNLPSSITSAAFTLRTQYQKYLYDYECEKEGLSTASDLQQAIDGNRREGRRNTSTSSNYPQVGYSVAATGTAHHSSTNLLSKHLNGTLSLRNGLDDDASLSSATQQAAFVAAYRAEQLAALEAQQRQFERAQRAAAEAVARHSAHANSSSNSNNNNNNNNSTSNNNNNNSNSNINSNNNSNSGSSSSDNNGNNSNNGTNCSTGHRQHHHLSGRESTSSADSDGASPAKRARACSSLTATGTAGATATTIAAAAAVAAAALSDENGLNNNLIASLATERLFGGIPSAHLKITSRGENSLVVSMEINGTMYQGVLFALGNTTTGGGLSTSQNPFHGTADAATLATGLNLATTLNNSL